MNRFHLIRSALGGSDVYDENGNRVGYSLPSVLGDGEDFYDLDGRCVGQSFESAFGGGEFFAGLGNDGAGFMDEEILMGRNAWLNGNPFGREENPGLDDLDPFDAPDAGADFGDDPGDRF